ncbi:MAG TPA: POTRA domain-containing protein [Terriglobales bacterium]|nr:POTRA domain-containing protein [Terriglobales bacterium]
MTRRIVLLYLLLSATYFTAVASFKLTAIRVTGSTRYTSKEILNEVGLQIGQQVTEADFQKATALLGETGMFGDVSYKFEYSDKGAILDFQLSDNPKLVPARFDNFVWFSDQELMEKLHQRVPLFRGELPLNGNLPDLVSDALQALLIERKVAGKADYLRASDQEGPIAAIAYNVEGLHIVVRNVDFTGAPPALLKTLQQKARELSHQEYLRSAMQPVIDKDLLPALFAHGYLKASLGQAHPKVVEDDADSTLVDLIFDIDAGHQYKFADAKWSGNKSFPAEKLDPLLTLQKGQPADGEQLEQDLEAVKHLYGTKGFMGAQIKPVLELDNAKMTVIYQLQVEEGDVYHMGDFDVHGLDNPMTKRLTLAWKLAEGEVYDTSYTQNYLKSLPATTINLSQWKIKTMENVDSRAKTVDVLFQFQPVPLD